MKYICLNIFLLCAPSLFGQNLELDSSFANAGKYTLSVYDANDIIDITSLENDSILILGQTGKADAVYYNMDMFLVKTDKNGNSDNTYGDGGVAILDFPGMDYSKGVEMFNNNGYTYLLGHGNSFDSIDYNPVCVSRLDGAGQLDTTLGENGGVFIDFYGFNEKATCFTFDEDQNLYLGGSSYDTVGVHYVPVVAKLNADFTLDTTFGGTGRMAIDVLLGVQPIRHLADGQVMDVLVTSNNRLFVAGSYGYQGFVAKLNNDGTFDNTFNGTGYIIFDLDIGYFQHEIIKLVELPNGELLFGMNVLELTQGDLYIGRIDTTSGSYVMEYIDFYNGEDLFQDLVLTPDNEVIAVAKSIDYSNAQQSAYRSDYFAVAKIQDYNQLGTQKKFTMRYDDYQSGALACTVQSDGGIVVGGFSFTDTPGLTNGAVIRVVEEAVSTTIHDPFLSNYKVYPNPASDYLYLNKAVDNAVVYDVTGKEVLKTSSTIIDVSRLNKGIYFLSVDGSSMIRWIKQ